MICPNCHNNEPRNLWICPSCGKRIEGGVVFVTGISGSATHEVIKGVVEQAQLHDHAVKVHDIGQIMYEYAREDDPNVQWDWILNADERYRKMLRNCAFEAVANDLNANPTVLHFIDTHLSFRWHVYLTRGIEPHVLSRFAPFTRCFISVVEDITKVRERLAKTSWGDRETLELLIWREEEIFMADLLKEVCGRVTNYVIAAAEPPSEIEKIVWHPTVKKVYLSFPITGILEDEGAQKEIEAFRDQLRGFSVVFYPYASKDYDETYQREEMKQIRKEIGVANRREGLSIHKPGRRARGIFPKEGRIQGCGCRNETRTTDRKANLPVQPWRSWRGSIRGSSEPFG